ncbi:MAG: putative nucleotidyltransferase [Halonotius sp. J07HN6]|nr:MAG: putative nucleotidyltransferase [Halonotius sp. J07HN6]
MESGAEDPQVDSVLDMSVCADPTVEFVVVFGSQCTGEATPASDIDVAIKFADDLSASERFEKRCFLSGDIQRDDAPFIDLSDIETLPLGVAHDAVNGTFVCGDEHAFERFKTAIEAAFDDQRDTLRRQQRDVIDRIAAEGLRG